MPKRKRGNLSPSPSDNDVSAARALAHRRTISASLFAASTKRLVSALRLGAGFERQKYSRRRKTAKQDNDEKAIARLEAEYAALKSLDIAKVAEQHLKKTVGKVKSLRESETLAEVWRESGEREKLSQEALNVTARLWKYKGVKEVVDETVEKLRDLVGTAGRNSRGEKSKVEEEVIKGNGEMAKSEPVENEAEAEHFDSEDEEELLKAYGARIAAPSSVEGDSEDELDDGMRPSSVVYSEASGDSEHERGLSISPNALDIGSSEDDEEDEDSAAIDDGDSASKSSESSDEDRSLEEESMPSTVSKSMSSAQPVERSSKSTFLPSLSMANYISGSESEASDLDDIAPKKNRRGQRARQKIWEAKFGDKAKHIKNNERKAGWDAKRGAVDSSHGRGARDGRARTGGRGPERSGENAIELGQRKSKRDDSGALHPSWAAAKAAKERKMDVKPQGKKVVFD